MTDLTPASVREMILRELRGSDLSVLVRQLQGSGIINETGATPLRLYGQFSFAYSITSATTGNFDVDVGVALAGKAWQPLGGPSYASPPPSWQEAVSWAYAPNGATTIRFSLRNNGSGTATGTFYFFLLTAG